MFDFVEYDPYMLSYIVGLNCNIDLVVKKAIIELEDDQNHIVKSIDVTDKLNKLVVRNNSLWIVDWQRDTGVKVKCGWFNL